MCCVPHVLCFLVALHGATDSCEACVAGHGARRFQWKACGVQCHYLKLTKCLPAMLTHLPALPAPSHFALLQRRRRPSKPARSG